MEKSLMYINGEWVGSDLEVLEVINPANGKVVGAVPFAGEAEANEAIDAAYEAFQSWSKTTAYERAGYLKNLTQIIKDNHEELAQIMTMEMGKPINESRGEALSCASFMEWFAEEAKRVYGETIPSHTNDKRLQVWKKPVGVVAAITPWNFPGAMLARKMAPALAAGCTIVIKPSGESPLTAIKMVEYCEQAGIPKGVVNLVTGSSSKIGKAIMDSSKVRKVTFTGSTEVGKVLIKQSADTVKRLSMELGGHAPIIILDDANLDVAVEGAIASKFRNAGQTCVCANRIYVQAGIHDEFAKRFAEATKNLSVGDGVSEAVDVGPLINQSSVDKVIRHVEDAVANGATVLAGGEDLAAKGGTFYAPTVLTNIDPDMLIMREETFGPVAPIQKFEDIDAVIKLANGTPYGLAAYVFTESVSKGTQIIEQLDFGIVGWNDGMPSTAQAPFGGMKESGMGKEGGREGLEAFLESQYVAIGMK